ncbi:PHP domain-containing protein [bacterium]|nr:PHP domain-containing protein [bacterium]
MLRVYKADFHIHTCLSPCGSLNMSPSTVVEQAVKKGLNIIFITDHNSCENAGSTAKIAETKKLTVFPGMEITSSEEVHILGLFDNMDNALKMQKIVYDNLPGKNDEKIFGMQPVVDEHGNVVSLSSRLLIGAARLNVQKIVRKIKELGGLAIASHVDRMCFSIIGQLGFIPDGLLLDGLEISDNENRDIIKNDYPQYPVVLSSDAHRLEDIGKRYTRLKLLKPAFTEIKKAFKNENGRGILSSM